MKKIFILCVTGILIATHAALAGEPAKLAIIAESERANEASDLLTVQLSGNTNVQLLERNQIDQVYREQGLSAGNKDFIKMGQILGADGLILMDVTPEKKSKTTMGVAPPVDVRVRLIAVKQGVVLSAQNFTTTPGELPAWAGSYATHLEPLIPKLSLLVKDAIPISLVSIRSATASADAAETERALALLTVERLSQERQFFVLERQHAAQATEEKELKLDSAPFWSGSYLLDGVFDRNGFDKDTIRIDATLSPPRGGATVAIQVSGSRANLAEVINALAARVDEAIKIGSPAPPWNAAEEAARYYDEGQWALKWQAFPQAQQASEAAWSLGKHDLESATLRVNAYMRDAVRITRMFDTLQSTFGPSYDGSGRVTGPRLSDSFIQGQINREVHAHPFGASYTIEKAGEFKIIHYVFAVGATDSHCLDSATRALDDYRDFSQFQPDAGQGVTAWYRLGADCLATAGHVLQYYNFFPQQRQAVENNVAGLRALARSVAQMMGDSPKVRDSYFVGSRVVTRDELADSMQHQPNLFRTEVMWGRYWQERPEDAIALYRELMSSPVFTYLHKDFWARPDHTPRLVAWTEGDRLRIPALWNSFTQELAGSPDVQHQLEAKALAIVDAENDEQKGSAFTNFFESLIASRDALLTNNVDVVYLHWGSDELVPHEGIVTPLTKSLEGAYRSKYRPKLEDMNQAYGNRRSGAVPTAKSEELFEEQKQYLIDNKPYDFSVFARLFAGDKNTRAQAKELLPLMLGYVSNMTARAAQLPESQRHRLAGNIAVADMIRKNLEREANAPAANPVALNSSAPPVNRPNQSYYQSPPFSQRFTPFGAPAEPEKPVTNIIAVTRFLEIPAARLWRRDVSNTFGGAVITAHQWVEEKLLLDLECSAAFYSFDARGRWIGTSNAQYPAIAVLDPKVGQWEVALGAPVGLLEGNHLYRRSTLFKGDIYTSSDREIARYDASSKTWKRLEVSDGNHYALFNVNHHLYAASDNAVMEIIDNGNASRLMASTRRVPPASALDSLSLGVPTLFEGPGDSLRIDTASGLFTWTGSDWRSDGPIHSTRAPQQIDFNPNGFGRVGGGNVQILPDGVLFLGSQISRLAKDSYSEELCLEQRKSMPGGLNYSQSFPTAMRQPAGAWTGKAKWDLPRTAPPILIATSHQPDLYVLKNHSQVKQIINETNHFITDSLPLPQDGYHAELLCFTPGRRLPLRVGLKFDAPHGKPPTGRSNPWIFATPDGLIFGEEILPLGFAQNAVADPKAFHIGVWMLPFAELQPAVIAAEQAPAAASSSRAATDPGGP